MTGPEEPREYLDRALADAGWDLKPVSEAIGKNHAYLQQYISRGKPRYLPEDVREALVQIVPTIDAERLKPPPVVLKASPRRKDGKPKSSDQAEVHPQRQGQFVDDPSALQLLDAWGRIKHPDRRALAIRILQSMADEAGSIVA